MTTLRNQERIFANRDRLTRILSSRGQIQENQRILLANQERILANQDKILAK